MLLGFGQIRALTAGTLTTEQEQKTQKTWEARPWNQHHRQPIYVDVRMTSSQRHVQNKKTGFS